MDWLAGFELVSSATGAMRSRDDDGMTYDRHHPISINLLHHHRLATGIKTKSMAAVLEKPTAVGAEQVLALPALRKAVPGLDPKLERLLGAIAQVKH